MKKISTLFLSLFISGAILAQETKKADLSTDNKGRPIYWNHIRLNLVGIAFSHFGLQYERKLGKKTSAGVALDIPSLGRKVDDFSLKISGFGLLPEFRYYLSKNSMRGFFLGLYGIYRTYNLNLTGTGSENLDVDYGGTAGVQSTTINYTASGDFKLNHIGLGFHFGPQFIIAKRVSLGINAGFSVGSLSFEPVFTYQGSGVNPTGQPVATQSYYEESGNVEITGSVSATATTTTINAQGKITGLAIPGILPRVGFNIGYVFGK